MGAGWLSTATERGERRFGPLPERVRIGTDRGTCELCLSPRTGAPAVAVELVRGPSGAWAVQPCGEPPWPVHVRRAQAPEAPPQAARLGTRLMPGDTLLLGPPANAVRLLLLDDTSAPPLVDRIEAATPLPVAAPPSADASAAAAAAPVEGSPLADELHRQTEARVLSRSPLAAQLATFRRQLSSGAATSPVVLVGVAITVLGTGCGGLLGGLALLSLWR